MEKHCNKCHSLKKQIEFHKKSNSTDGRDSRCKLCVSQYKKKKNLKQKNNQIIISEEINGALDVSDEFYSLLLKL